MEIKTLLITIAVLNLAISSAAQDAGTFQDSRDGKVYKTTRIGEQTWMAENLAFKADKGCWEYDNDQNNVTYGRLYNWKTAKSACPSGWHLPTNYEFKVLINFLGGDSLARVKLKEAGTSYWIPPDHRATNETGFTALPGGSCDNAGKNTFIGTDFSCWSSTEYGSEQAYNLLIGQKYYGPIRAKVFKTRGTSVRCVMDYDEETSALIATYSKNDVEEPYSQSIKKKVRILSKAYPAIKVGYMYSKWHSAEVGFELLHLIGTPREHYGTMGLTLGSEFLFDNKIVFGPKICAEANVAILGTRINAIYYTADFKTGSFKIRPEIGITLLGYISVFYGRTINYSNPEFYNQKSSISVFVNIPITKDLKHIGK